MKCPENRGILISGVSFKRGSTVLHTHALKEEATAAIENKAAGTRVVLSATLRHSVFTNEG